MMVKRVPPSGERVGGERVMGERETLREEHEPKDAMGERTVIGEEVDVW